MVTCPDCPSLRAELEKKTRHLERAHVDVSSARAKLRERISINARLRTALEQIVDPSCREFGDAIEIAREALASLTAPQP